MPLGDLSKEYARTFFVLKDNSDDRLWTTYREVIDFLTCVIELVHYCFLYPIIYQFSSFV